MSSSKAHKGIGFSIGVKVKTAGARPMPPILAPHRPRSFGPAGREACQRYFSMAELLKGATNIAIQPHVHALAIGDDFLIEDLRVIRQLRQRAVPQQDSPTDLIPRRRSLPCCKNWSQRSPAVTGQIEGSHLGVSLLRIASFPGTARALKCRL